MILEHCGRASCVQTIEALREKVTILTQERDRLVTIGLDLQMVVQKLTAMTQERDAWEQDFNRAIANCQAESARLAAAQARNAVLREALSDLRDTAQSSGFGVMPLENARRTAIDYQQNKAFEKALEALATPDDSSAFDAALKAERVRCMQECCDTCSDAIGSMK